MQIFDRHENVVQHFSCLLACHCQNRSWYLRVCSHRSLVLSPPIFHTKYNHMTLFQRSSPDLYPFLHDLNQITPWLIPCNILVARSSSQFLVSSASYIQPHGSDLPWCWHMSTFSIWAWTCSHSCILRHTHDKSSFRDTVVEINCAGISNVPMSHCAHIKTKYCPRQMM